MKQEIKLIQPVEIIRRKDGFYIHPDLPFFDEGEEDKIRAWSIDQGLEEKYVYMFDDMPDVLLDKSFDGDYMDILPSWEPSKPEGAGWFLVGIWDTEDDGPIASFVRRPNLAQGHSMSKLAWDNFVSRLRHDCVGEGVNRHCTADAIFIVQTLVLQTGIDREVAEGFCIVDDGSVIRSHAAWYMRLCDDELKEKLDQAMADYGSFCKAPSYEAFDLVAGMELDDVYVTGYVERWDYVNSHFTREAAEAFIKRKAHNHIELRVYVDAQTHCWEFNAIKQAIIEGQIKFVD